MLVAESAETCAGPDAELVSSAANENAAPRAFESIRVLALDVDGVLTDGTEGIFPRGEGVSEKRISLRDLDALTELRQRGFCIGLLTGERGELVEAIGKRVQADFVITGEKDKLRGIDEICRRYSVTRAHICYVGDSDRDAPALRRVGLGLAPHDGSSLARSLAHRVLNHRGGRGVVAEAASILLDLRHDEDEDFLPHANAILNASLEAHRRLVEKGAQPIVAIARSMCRCLARGGKVLFCGNGGSAADAQHAAAELMGRFAKNRAPLSALSLTTDTSVLTAVGNDWEYEEIFSRQVRGLARPGDIVLGLSTSGRSENVRRALVTAREVGALAVSFTGMTRGPVADASDLEFTAPSTDTPRIQELHILALHSVCELVERSLFEEHPEE